MEDPLYLDPLIVKYCKYSKPKAGPLTQPQYEDLKTLKNKFYLKQKNK